MGTCRYCGLNTPGKQTVCQTCQKYFRQGGELHPLPEKGMVAYTADDKVVCHICGMAFTKLSEHVKKKHHLTDREYREQFGLMVTARLTSKAYQDKMSKSTKASNVYVENFKDTWSGEKRCLTGRQGNKQSLQEINQRREEQRIKGSLSKTRISPERMNILGKIWIKNLNKGK